MTASRIKTTANGPILEIMFDHPPANAIDQQASRDIDAALERLRLDPALRVGIVHANPQGRIFSAGWDLKAVAAGDRGEDFGQHGFMSLERQNLNKPLIAAVHGLAIGGGFEFALMCNIVLAAPGTEFGLPELMRGFLPEAGGLWRALRRLPVNIAYELLLTGRRMGAEEGLRHGFVNHIVPMDDLLARARQVAGQIVAGAPLAVEALLEVARAVETLPDAEAFSRMRSGLPAHRRMRQSEDFHEGPRAFAEKRPPQWKGQ
jgi:crotonobetainyl-CoA hydratase